VGGGGGGRRGGGWVRERVMVGPGAGRGWVVGGREGGGEGMGRVALVGGAFLCRGKRTDRGVWEGARVIYGCPGMWGGARSGAWPGAMVGGRGGERITWRGGGSTGGEVGEGGVLWHVGWSCGKRCVQRRTPGGGHGGDAGEVRAGPQIGEVGLS